MSKLYNLFSFLLVIFFVSPGTANTVWADDAPVNDQASQTGQTPNPEQQIRQEQPLYIHDIKGPDYKIPASLKDKFIEKWEIMSARTTAGGTLDKQYMLSPQSFFKYLDHKHIQFRLNEFYPVQYGEFYQSPLRIDIKLYKNPNCTECFEQLTITRKSEQDSEFLLEFNGHQQLFTVNQIRKAP